MLRALIDSKLYLALAALVLCLQTQVQLGMHPEVHPYLFVVFFSTLLVYNYPKVSVLLTRSPSFHKQSLGFYVLVLSALVGLAISLFMAQQEILALVLPLGALTLWYSIPLLITKQKSIKLRTIPYAKIFIIALVWSAATVLIPYAHPSCTKGLSEFFLTFAERFFYIFAITIPFDIRDLALDQKSGLKTLPMLFEARSSEKLSYLALSIFFLLACIHNVAAHLYFVLVAESLSFGLTLSFLSMERFRKWPLYHSGLLDGSMLMQGFLVLLFYYCK